MKQEYTIKQVIFLTLAGAATILSLQVFFYSSYRIPVYAGIGAAVFFLINFFLSRVGNGGGLAKNVPKSEAFISFAGLNWSFEDSCRHWLCVGKSGCGKTIGFIKGFIIQITRNTPKRFKVFWGGVMTDEKGDFFELAESVFKAEKRSQHLKVFKVAQHAQPMLSEHTINLIANPRISWDTKAQIVVDVAVSQGQKTSNAHFKTLAKQYIADIFKTLEILELPVTLKMAYLFISDEAEQIDMMKDLRGIAAEGNTVASGLHLSWLGFLQIDHGELSGLKTTIKNYLYPYTTPEIAEVFCATKPNTRFEEVDEGMVFCPSIPQAHIVERSYITAFFKILFYIHGLSRFDKGSQHIRDANPLFLISDEAQSSILPSEEGLSDIKALDKLRAAKCTVVMAMQDFASALPPIESKEKADVLFANLNTQIIFALNTDPGAKIASAAFGELEIQKVSRTVDNKGRVSRTYTKQYEPLFREKVFRRELINFHAIIRHPQGIFKKASFPPLDDNGKVADWYQS